MGFLSYQFKSSKSQLSFLYHLDNWRPDLGWEESEEDSKKSLNTRLFFTAHAKKKTFFPAEKVSEKKK